MPKTRKRHFIAVITLVLGMAAIQWGNEVARAFEDNRPSTSIGTVSNGSLENGKRLPTSGPNYTAYSRVGALLGRNTVHSSVRDVVVEAYGALESSAPGWLFTYGETGWPSGGRIRPHRSHQNGLSVDFMMPVRSAASAHEPVRFPASLFNQAGYGLEFDRFGVHERYQIDFEIVARHLLALTDASRHHGLTIRKVIVAPEYLPLLRATPSGSSLHEKLPFMHNSAWVRHDEHYHVDFSVDSPRSNRR
ncbi:MAG TPA: penicillin-insensitive murein endopeptidase [Polyangiaceae bacterium]|nr:penicillin-insensitive murein endopeptidase [Polyangiaceae bacterium]